MFEPQRTRSFAKVLGCIEAVGSRLGILTWPAGFASANHQRFPFAFLCVLGGSPFEMRAPRRAQSFAKFCRVGPKALACGLAFCSRHLAVLGGFFYGFSLGVPLRPASGSTFLVIAPHMPYFDGGHAEHGCFLAGIHRRCDRRRHEPCRYRNALKSSWSACADAFLKALPTF